MNRTRSWAWLLASFISWASTFSAPIGNDDPSPFGPSLSVSRQLPNVPSERPARNRIDQTLSEAHAKSVGCIQCHKGIEDMHKSPAVVLGCTDCHGGDPTPGLTQRKAHVSPKHEIFWKSSANPNESSVLLNH